MELISPLLKVDFREFCVNNFVLRQIDDIFKMARINKGQVPSDRVMSGQRRNLVEEYYASLDWNREQDVAKFLTVLGYALAQQYRGDDQPRKQLRMMCERQGLFVDGIQVHLKPPKPQSKAYAAVSAETLQCLNQRLLALDKIEAQKRGFEFERFLKDLFDAHNLAPRSPFRLEGEQIDGSFELGGDIYLLEAKWQAKQSSQQDLLIFREKVEGKSTWSRGLFVSISGFTEDGIKAYARGRATNIIGMSGQDLYFILDGEMSLVEAISRKVRLAAETGEFYVSVFEMQRN
jgi:hypothetical protein